MIITIDGPAASGKSTIARMVAHKLDGTYCNSGFLYRGLAYGLLSDGHDLHELLENGAIEQVAHVDENKLLSYTYDNERGASVVYKQQDITSYLKTPEVDALSSALSVHSHVRDYVTEMQRVLARQVATFVVDGRDAGSVVFPEADYKFFVTADAAVRAQRWRDALQEKGMAVTLEDALREITQRDERDTSRAVAPLVIPEGAHIIDSSKEDALQICKKFFSMLKADSIGRNFF